MKDNQLYMQSPKTVKRNQTSMFQLRRLLY